jgi:hypothetical protein
MGIQIALAVSVQSVVGSFNARLSGGDMRSFVTAICESLIHTGYGLPISALYRRLPGLLDSMKLMSVSGLIKHEYHELN